MDEWLSKLPFWWMVLVVAAVTYVTTGVIFAVISILGRGERLRTFKGVSIGLLSPLGTIFGLLVVFILAQVWSDFDRAEVAVDREASALRMVTLLVADSFPGEPDTKIRDLLRRHIDGAVSVEWPAMQKESASLQAPPAELNDALRFALSLKPNSDGQIVAQREMVAALENAFDARRHRLILSGSGVNWIKWTCLFAQAILVVAAIGIAHIENRVAAALAMAIFAGGVVVSVALIASHDRPFSGSISVKPTVLLQVRPDD